MANVAYVRPELSRMMPQYYLIRDCIEGSDTIKRKTNRYLPVPDGNTQNPTKDKRYIAYILRAVFYNVTRRTLLGLTGQVFMRDPIVKNPTQLQPVLDDATGSGVSMEQQARKSVQMTLAYSRSGIMVDYPDTSGLGGASIASVEAGNIRPTICTYSPMEIVNWRVMREGAKEKLSLVVLFELFCIEDDGFETKHGGQFRVLSLDENGFYQAMIFQEDMPSQTDGSELPGKHKVFNQVEVYYPTGANGQRLTEIPFSFIGSDNNDSSIDNPNMYDLADLNIAHYRNSADYEEALFISGQPTVVVTGLSESWLKEQLKGTVSFGSRGGIPLPVGATASLLQAAANTMIKEAMDTKERQMVALGAKLVQQQQVQRTAFETKVETTGEGSVLSNTAKNVSQAYEWALKWCATFMGLPTTGIEFQLNDDFDISSLTAEEQAQAISAWQAGAVTWEEMRTRLRKAGIATVDDAKAKAEIDADTVAAMALLPTNTADPLNPGNPPDPNKPAPVPAKKNPEDGS